MRKETMTTIQFFNPIKIKFGTYFKKGLVLGPRHDDVSLSKVTTHVLKIPHYWGDDPLHLAK